MYRFTLSATKDLHVNDLRLALLNFMSAKQAQKQFVIRIDDTDKEHPSEGKEHDSLDTLALFHLSYQQLYYHSHNFKYHLQFASTLLDTKKAFICFCSKDKDEETPYDGRCEHLSSDEILDNPNPFVIRMKKPQNAIGIQDSLRGHLRFEPDVIDNTIIMSAHKYPSYDFACACDDMLQGITAVIEDETTLLHTPKQEAIRNALGYHETINYTHLPTLTCKEEESSVAWLLNQGFMPEAIANYLLLLSAKTPTEIFSIDEALMWFDSQSLLPTQACFDIEKLRFLNREHIKRLDDMELSKRIGYACNNIGKLAKLYADECHTTADIKAKVDLFFAPKGLHVSFEKESATLREIIQKAPFHENFDAFQSYLMNQSELKEEAFLKPLQFLLTGSDSSPKLEQLYPHIKHYLKEIVR